jgi:hypothetical protein
MRHVSLCYNELINGTFKIACEEIAPYVLKAVIHPSVKCLDILRNEAHPTRLDYYKDINIDLIYRTLPLLQGFKTLRLGKTMRTANFPLKVEGFKNTLEEFSFSDIWQNDLSTVAEHCKYLKRLDFGGPISFVSLALHYISNFKYLEALNISQLYYLSEYELCLILLWLAGNLVYDEISEGAGSSRTRTGDTSEGSGMSSVAEGSRTYPARNPGLLKSFGCLNATDKHITLISQFYNLTSLVLVNPYHLGSLTPLGSLKRLKNFALTRYIFSDTKEVLKSIGNQLICFNLRDVRDIDLAFISENCRSLECLHICFSSPLLSSLGRNYHQSEPGSVPIAVLPHVTSLQIGVPERLARRYVLQHVPNLKKLSVVFPDDDLALFESLIERQILKSLNELYWSNDVIVYFEGNIVTRIMFHFYGEVTVEHIRM